MNIKRFLGEIFFVAMLLCSEETLGQTFTQITSSNYSSLGVSSSYVGCWLLDCSMIEADRLASGSLTDYDDVDLPSGVLTSSNYSSWSNQFYTHCEDNSTINRVYPKLIISDADLTYSSSSTATWYNMVNAVNGLTYKGATDWRLPTQRELMLILILAQNNSTFLATFISNYYWSATTMSSFDVYVWIVNFNSNTGFVNSKTTTTYYARPVKEL